MYNPLVSIIIPAYNCESFLSATIESALNQTWQNKEIIIVDDGSTDSSLSIAKQYESVMVKTLHQRNGGASSARNFGLREAKGEFIQFLDADDLLAPQKIELQIATLKDNPGFVSVCRTAHFFEYKNLAEEKVEDDDSFFKDHLNNPLKFLIKLYGGFDLTGGMIQPNAFLIPKGIVEKAGAWNTELSLDDDGEYFCRIVLNSSGITYLNSTLNYYRKYNGGKSLSGSVTEKAYRSFFKSLKLKHFHLLSACEDTNLIKYIHTATYKSVEELLLKTYPRHIELHSEIARFLHELDPHLRVNNRAFGGRLANFLGNNVSWKLLRRLQELKLLFS